MPVESSASRHAKVDVMDGLRGLAIAMVVWYHVWQITWAPNSLQIGGMLLNGGVIAENGFVGVALFFFISGFCLYYPYARHRIEGRDRPTLRHYAWRRAIKILPSYWLSIALILLWQRPDLGGLGGTFQQLASHLLFIHNWAHATEGGIDGVYWSLGVEVQFYVLFPLLILAFLRRPVLSWAIGVTLAIAYRHGINAAYPHDNRFWIDQLPGYADLFFDGMLTSYLVVALRRHAARLAPWRYAFSALTIVGFGLFWLLLNSLYLDRVHPGWPVIWQVGHREGFGLVFMGIAVCAAFADRVVQRVIANPLLVFLSTISYNLYIWHQVIARALLAAHVPAAMTTDPHADPHWQWLFSLVAVTVSLAWTALITYGFERPLLREGLGWLRRPFVRRRAIAPAE